MFEHPELIVPIWIVAIGSVVVGLIWAVSRWRACSATAKQIYDRGWQDGVWHAAHQHKVEVVAANDRALAAERELKLTREGDNEFIDSLRDRLRDGGIENDEQGLLWCVGTAIVERDRARAACEQLRADVEEWEQSFELYDAAMTRAARMYRERHPEYPSNKWPDAAERLTSLFEQFDEANARTEQFIDLVWAALGKHGIEWHGPGDNPALGIERLGYILKENKELLRWIEEALVEVLGDEEVKKCDSPDDAVRKIGHQRDQARKELAWWKELTSEYKDDHIEKVAKAIFEWVDGLPSGTEGIGTTFFDWDNELIVDSDVILSLSKNGLREAIRRIVLYVERAQNPLHVTSGVNPEITSPVLRFLNHPCGIEVRKSQFGEYPRAKFWSKEKDHMVVVRSQSSHEDACRQALEQMDE